MYRKNFGRLQTEFHLLQASFKFCTTKFTYIFPDIKAGGLRFLTSLYVTFSGVLA